MGEDGLRALAAILRGHTGETARECANGTLPLPDGLFSLLSSNAQLRSDAVFLNLCYEKENVLLVLKIDALEPLLHLMSSFSVLIGWFRTAHLPSWFVST